MVAFIEGKITSSSPTQVVIQTGGVGYELQISLVTYEAIKSREKAHLHVHEYAKKEGQVFSGFEWYGFFTAKERAVFRLLIGISGIGANTARTMLSSYSPGEITSAIATGNVSLIKSIKGIGLKTAERVVLELKDKVITLDGSPDEEIPVKAGTLNNSFKEEALSALCMLGFSRKQAEKGVLQALKKNIEIEDVEPLIKEALKHI